MKNSFPNNLFHTTSGAGCSLGRQHGGKTRDETTSPSARLSRAACALLINKEIIQFLSTAGCF